ncbi:hypothetical protein BT96DRAFT_261809 [Gymnopus androsaceus JB14]|uniref:Uncharacterized protein n=1 Tax=Gymnopus androsaceus JB14 TaxID=1447944 RepID=A0A6A4H6C3_9AGAR|nr:hypothetical protein BT96DRAFT_261809 [Gymnopus androsaceus JB14]
MDYGSTGTHGIIDRDDLVAPSSSYTLMHRRIFIRTRNCTTRTLTRILCPTATRSRFHRPLHHRIHRTIRRRPKFIPFLLLPLLITLLSLPLLSPIRGLDWEED